jgi:hypothetical protein
VVNGSLDLAARAARSRAVLFGKAIQDTATDFDVQWQMHQTRDARVFGCHLSVWRVEIYRVKSLDLSVAAIVAWRWRAASTEAFALYVIVEGCGRAPKTFPKCAYRRACSRLGRIT